MGASNEHYLLALIAVTAIIAMTIMTQGVSVTSLSPMEMTMTGQYLGIGHSISTSITGHAVAPASATSLVQKAENRKQNLETHREAINSNTKRITSTKRVQARDTTVAKKTFADNAGVIDETRPDAQARLIALFKGKLKGYDLFSARGVAVPTFTQRFSSVTATQVYSYCSVNKDSFEKSTRGCYLLANAHNNAEYASYQDLTAAAFNAGVANGAIDCAMPPWKKHAGCMN